MAIASQCYIRDISKKHQKLLEKASKELELKTTPSILMKILEKYFHLKDTIMHQEKLIEELREYNQQERQKYSDLQIECRVMLKMEIEVESRKLELLKKL